MAAMSGAADGPRNLVVLLLDSLNRHLLGSYGGDRVRHAEPRSLRARGRCASPATSPARCRACRRATTSSCGALDFLWRPWGSIELWEEPITAAAAAGRRDDDARHRPSAPVRDRRRELPHRLHARWDYVRGHEGDPWRTYADPSWVGAPALPAGARRLVPARRYDGTPHAGSTTESRLLPGRGRLPAAARRWLERPTGCATRRRTTRSCCSSTSSIPHEPFDTPEPWAGALRPRLGRRAAHLAAVRRSAPSAEGRLDRARGRGTSAPTTAPSCR